MVFLAEVSTGHFALEAAAHESSYFGSIVDGSAAVAVQY